MEKEKQEKKLVEKTNWEIQKEEGITTHKAILTNISDEDNTLKKTKAIYNILAKTLAKTLGPYGMNTILQGNKAGESLITKDGYDVYSRLQFNDDIAETVHEIIREAVSNQADKAGDGTTSAVILGNAVYQNVIAKKEMFKETAPKDIIDIIGDVSDYCINEIVKTAQKVTVDSEEIKWIASTSLNNDLKGGEFIQNVFKDLGNDAFVITDVDKTNNKGDYYVPIFGFETDYGWSGSVYNTIYENTSGKLLYSSDTSVKKTKPRILIIRGTLTKELYTEMNLQDLITNVCIRNQEQLVIMANDYDREVLAIAENMRLFHKRFFEYKDKPYDFVLTTIDDVANANYYLVEDLAKMLGIKIFHAMEDLPLVIQADTEEYLGTLDLVEMTKRTSKFIIPEKLNDEEKQKTRDEYIANVQQEYDKLTTDVISTNEDMYYKKEGLRARLNRFKKSNAIVYPGGKTLSEKQSRERLLEDATKAVRNALDFGYVYGGFLSASRVLFKTKNRKEIIKMLTDKYFWIENKEVFNEILDILEVSYIQVYQAVLANSKMNNDNIDIIIKKCLKQDLFFNLKDRKFYKLNPEENEKRCEIINPVTTDVEILNSVLSIVKLLLNTNQFITRQLINDTY